MNPSVDVILTAVVLLNFVVLGTTRIHIAIRASAAQGLVLSLLPVLSGHGEGWRMVSLALGAAALKGVLIPWLLLKALRDVAIRREVEPYVSFVTSLVLCAVGTAAALLFAGRLPLAPEHQGTLIVPTALAMLWAGFLGVSTRRKAVTQVVGYLVLENGIFVFGQLLIGAMPFLVEAGALLDLLAAVFVMGIVVNHIQREFSSVDIASLSRLKE